MMVSSFSPSSPPPTAAALSPSHRRLSSPSVRYRCPAERQALFSRIAPVYDNLNDLLTLGLHRVWKRMAVSWSGARKRDRVLDLCCGSGDLAFLLSERVGPDGEVTGLDFSKEQLLIASTRQGLSGKTCHRNIVWVEGDALNLSFPACYFDAVTVGYGLRNLVDKHKAMEEIFRVLKPGSRVSILDFNKSSSAITTSFQNPVIISGTYSELTWQTPLSKGSTLNKLICWQACNRELLSKCIRGFYILDIAPGCSYCFCLIMGELPFSINIYEGIKG